LTFISTRSSSNSFERPMVESVSLPGIVPSIVTFKGGSDATLSAPGAMGALGRLRPGRGIGIKPRFMGSQPTFFIATLTEIVCKITTAATAIIVVIPSGPLAKPRIFPDVETAVWWELPDCWELSNSFWTRSTSSLSSFQWRRRSRMAFFLFFCSGVCSGKFSAVRSMTLLS